MPTIPFTATRMHRTRRSSSVGTALNMIRNVCVANLTGHPPSAFPAA
jgi:hypothetical protein